MRWRWYISSPINFLKVFDLDLPQKGVYFRLSSELYFLNTMVSAITEGVKVTVVSEYQPAYSSPSQAHFVFTYKVTIENRSDFTVKLLRRHWFIHDSNGGIREVEGEGVVGQQPVLEPGEVHEYVSGCNLKTNIGKMGGTYLMERLLDGKQMDVRIPEFVMIHPARLN
jgi:ApaG protein